MAIFFSEPTQLDSALSSDYFTLSAADRGRIWHAKVYYDFYYFIIIIPIYFRRIAQ